MNSTEPVKSTLIQLVLDCMESQDAINKVIDLDWVKKKRDWELAITVEMAEFCEHVSFKWWKKQSPDWSQAFIELTDIYHFLLSRVIESEIPATYLAKAVERHQTSPIQNQDVRIAKTHVYAKEIIHKSTGKDSLNAQQCEEIMGLLIALAEFCGRTTDEFFQFFLSKLQLNIFRQRHGYKDGTYIKIWDGREDNEVMHDLIQANPELGLNANMLYSALEAAYPEAARA
ncbi:dUTP diphosphatase [Zhongshania aliphaticivorans]|uniref:dUTP diphosphatase n=1 Tax=Zhongshania aliphaticivorans TaxID=1470434 RepID=UPI00132FE166|nr:dUTP diphosphatase [Zhongshania aliphaticivorans]